VFFYLDVFIDCECGIFALEVIMFTDPWWLLWLPKNHDFFVTAFIGSCWTLRN